MANPNDPKPRTGAAQAPAESGGRKLLVINHSNSPIRIPIQEPGKDAEKDRPKVHDHITLLPGANAVDPDYWDLVKDIDTIKILCRKKTRGGLEVGDSRIDVSNLGSIGDEDEAKELVDETVDADLLRTWKRTEKRPALVKALEEQLEKIDPRKDTGQGEDGEDLVVS